MSDVYAHLTSGWGHVLEGPLVSCGELKELTYGEDENGLFVRLLFHWFGRKGLGEQGWERLGSECILRFVEADEFPSPQMLLDLECILEDGRPVQVRVSEAPLMSEDLPNRDLVLQSQFVSLCAKEYPSRLEYIQ